MVPNHEKKKKKHNIGYYKRLQIFLTTYKIHTITQLRITATATYCPLHSVLGFWPLAVAPTSTTIFILDLEFSLKSELLETKEELKR